MSKRGTFSWDAISEVDSYQLDYRIVKTTGDWTKLYEGALNGTTNKPPVPGDYDIRVRAIKDEIYGNWSTAIEVSLI